jgi:hypothetical protein
MNHIIDRSNNFDVIFESQRSISKRINISRRSVSRLSTTVSQKGLVIKKSRGRVGLMKNTCEYILPEIWEDPEVRKRFKHILPALQMPKRYNSIQSVKNNKYLSYKIIQTASVAYIKVSPSIISLNSVSGDTNMHIGNERSNCKSKKVKLQRGNKMVEAQKGFNDIALQCLEAYPKGAITHATKKIHGRTLTGDAWLYYKKILNEWCTKNNVEPDYALLNTISGIPRLTLPIPRSSNIAQPTTSYQKKQQESKPYVPTKEWTSPEPPKKKETAIQIANNLARATEMLKSGNQFAQYALKGITEIEYETTGEEGEAIAIEYINKKKKEYETAPSLAEKLKELDMGNEPPPKKVNNNLATLYEILKKYDTSEPIKNKPESITINEEDFDEVLD